jgi:perosamine synthetase
LNQLKREEGLDKKFIPIAKVQLSNDEIEAAVKVLRSGNLRQGERVEEFEAAFAKKVGAKYTVAVSSGTAALHIAYLSILKEGGKVLLPSFSHISTASMVCYSNCKPIFCDIDPRTFTFDANDAKSRLIEGTVAIVPVHLFGNSCDINKIANFARENDLKIIWDAAQAHGTKYKGKDVGSFDDLVCYSFYPTKNITTGEGGMITTNDPELYEKCRLLRSHGQVKKYFHSSLGLNYRMTDIEASIGIEQLKKLDILIEKRRKNAKYLTEYLSTIDGIITPFVEDGVEHSFNQYSVLLDLERLNYTRDEFVKSLRKESIGAAIHYPRPLHKQPAFCGLVGHLTLPVSEDIAERILSLPIHPFLNASELKQIELAIRKVFPRMEYKRSSSQT